MTYDLYGFKIRSSVLHFRFARLVFGLRPSQTILGAVVTHHFAKHRLAKPELVSLLQKSLYVDDLVTVEEAFNLYKSAKGLKAEAGMKFRKWYSNSSDLMKLIRADEFNIFNGTVDKRASVMEEEKSFANS